MQSQVSAKLRLEVGNRMDNLKATAIELFRRASELEYARAALDNKYTYEITTDEGKKREARKHIGSLSVQVLEGMRDELIVGGVTAWLQMEKLQTEKEDKENVSKGTKLESNDTELLSQPS